jgi:hypothetical protein
MNMNKERILIKKNGYHEEGIRGWNKSFEFVLPLFEFSRWIQQINIVLKNLKTLKIRNQNRKRNQSELNMLLRFPWFGENGENFRKSSR